MARLGSKLVVLVAIAVNGCTATGHAELDLTPKYLAWSSGFTLRMGSDPLGLPLEVSP